MNTNQMVNSLYENLNAVQVVFNGESQMVTKEYTYKTFEALEVGDFCVVDSPRDGLAIVKVVGVDSSLLEEDCKFEWIVTKIDLDSYNKLVEDEAEAVETLSRKIREGNRKKSIELVKEMVGEDEVMQLSAELNKNAIIEGRQ